ncbi:YtrH family sporulation protein [Paenibacillus sp. y28]|uniref:YtrH family sporulation protein n=1 Tax=Paenibacillus sp. y28 TaxID=3129110 RepID=UPI003018805F
METFVTKLISYFFVSLGVVLGASLLGGIGAVLTLQPPSLTMDSISRQIKIWAIVAAIGGTIDPIRIIESNLIGWHFSPVIKQVLFILGAFLGAHLGTVLVGWISGGGGKP